MFAGLTLIILRTGCRCSALLDYYKNRKFWQW